MNENQRTIGGWKYFRAEIKSVRGCLTPRGRRALSASSSSSEVRGVAENGDVGDHVISRSARGAGIFPSNGGWDS